MRLHNATPPPARRTLTAPPRLAQHTRAFFLRSPQADAARQRGALENEIVSVSGENARLEKELRRSAQQQLVAQAAELDAARRELSLLREPLTAARATAMAPRSTLALIEDSMLAGLQSQLHDLHVHFCDSFEPARHIGVGRVQSAALAPPQGSDWERFASPALGRSGYAPTGDAWGPNWRHGTSPSPAPDLATPACLGAPKSRTPQPSSSSGFNGGSGNSSGGGSVWYRQSYWRRKYARGQSRGTAASRRGLVF